MSDLKLNAALKLAQRGFYTFPLSPDSKFPAWKGSFRSYASTDLDVVRMYWKDPLLQDFTNDYNIGICTDKFEDGALVVVDVDVDGKKGIDGRKANLDLPETFTVKTPRGGFHKYYKVKKALKQGASVLAKGIDIRSSGGYVAGPGSTIDGKAYTIETDTDVRECPDWIIEKLGESHRKEKSAEPDQYFPVDVKKIEEVIQNAPFAKEGERTHVSYKIACKLKDLGLSDDEILDALSIWNEEKCHPLLTTSELQHQVESASRYSRDPRGNALAEFHFDAIEDDDFGDGDDDSCLKYNKEYAVLYDHGDVVVARILKDGGRWTHNTLTVQGFHTLFQYDKADDKKNTPLTKFWIGHPKRRTFFDVRFDPKSPPGPNEKVKEPFLNLWSGFSTEPLNDKSEATDLMKDVVNSYLQHIYENACDSNRDLFNWLMGFFAHIFQHPNTKNLVAPVFSGRRGVGKDSILNPIGYLLGKHYIMCDSPRLLMGNFNSPLEQSLFCVFNEAFWSGDKKAEGVLKNLITGGRHNIERKGVDIYQVENFTRIAIVGNENWLVPAAVDERRFAVFTMGEKRKQDVKFFQKLEDGWRTGGALKLLLRYLLDFNLQDVQLNIAPETKGLSLQKLESFGPLESWWRDCLESGFILGAVEEKWPDQIGSEEALKAIGIYCRNRNIRSYLPSVSALGRFFSKVGLEHFQIRSGDSRGRYAYKLSSVEECRESFCKVFDVQVDWEGENE